MDGQQGYNHETHAAGTGTDAFAWTLNIPEDGTYAYVKFPKVTGAATTAKYTLTYDGGTADKTVDQNATANQGTWVSLGSYSFKQGNDAELRLFQNSGGTVVADGVKLVRTSSAGTRRRGAAGRAPTTSPIRTTPRGCSPSPGTRPRSANRRPGPSTWTTVRPATVPRTTRRSIHSVAHRAPAPV
ncbi:golvesin C-terminal-like domain-containing protein [Streptomyces spiralis]